MLLLFCFPALSLPRIVFIFTFSFPFWFSPAFQQRSSLARPCTPCPCRAPRHPSAAGTELPGTHRSPAPSTLGSPRAGTSRPFPGRRAAAPAAPGLQPGELLAGAGMKGGRLRLKPRSGERSWERSGDQRELFIYFNKSPPRCCGQFGVRKGLSGGDQSSA